MCKCCRGTTGLERLKTCRHTIRGTPRNMRDTERLKRAEPAAGTRIACGMGASGATPVRAAPTGSTRCCFHCCPVRVTCLEDLISIRRREQKDTDVQTRDCASVKNSRFPESSQRDCRARSGKRSARSINRPNASQSSQRYPAIRTTSTPRSTCTSVRPVRSAAWNSADENWANMLAQ